MRTLIIWLCVTCLSVIPCSAQVPTVFEHIETNEHTIFCNFRDADGVVWVGTSNGLTTYAQLMGGYPFSTFRHPALEEIVEQISQDNLGRLWLRRQSGELIIYDAHHNQVIDDVPAYLKEQNLPSTITCSHIDMKGRAWIGSGSQLVMHDFKTSNTRSYQLPASTGEIRLLHDGGARLLAATAHHIYCVDTLSEKVRALTATPAAIEGYGNHLGSDNQGNIWLATMYCVYRFDAQSLQWKSYPDIRLSKAIITLPQGETCIASSNYGLYLFGTDGQMTEHLTQTPPNTQGLKNSHIESISYDATLKMLVVTYAKRDMTLCPLTNNGFQLLRLASANSHYQPAEVISVVAAADDRSFWAGTEDYGAFHVSLDKDHPIIEQRFNGQSVPSLFCDSRGGLWAGLFGHGLAAPDGRTLFSFLSPYAIIEPLPGKRLFMTMLGAGLQVLDPQTGEQTVVPTDNPWITKVVAKDGMVYALTASTIYEVDASTLLVKSFPLSSFITDHDDHKGFRDLLIDSRGWLWTICSTNHLPVHILNLKTRKTLVDNHLAGYIIHAIAEDEDGNIWLTTDKGVLRVTVKEGNTTEGFTYHRYAFGHQRMFYYNDHALCILPNGLLAAGTNKGVVLFDTRHAPDNQKEATKPLAPIITALRVNSQDMTKEEVSNMYFGEENRKAVLMTDLIYARELKLAYNENSIELECRPRDYVNNVDDAYFYRLEGLDDDWHVMDDFHLSFSKLAPGNYDLFVRYINDHADEPADFHVLHIIVRPPFWMSIPGRLLQLTIFLLLAALAYFFIRNRIHFRRELQQMEQQKREEARLNEMKMQFFTNISHDLRTPLTLIIAPVSDLLNKFSQRKGEEQTVKTLGVVRRNAERLLTLVNQLLDSRRIEESLEQLNLEKTDLNTFIDFIADNYSEQATRRNITLTVLHAPRSSSWVLIDREKTVRILDNLISNSFKFTPDGGRIMVNCQQVESVKSSEDSEANTYRFTITDTGRGIPEEDLPHIFDRFYTSRKLHLNHNSSGLGLYIVHQYVQLMGGTISVSNNKPHGTLFTIDIPLQPAKKSRALPADISTVNVPHPSAEQDIPASISNDTSRGTVLLVEDNSDLQQFISTSLSENYHILTANNGKEALDVLNSREDIDVVVSDIMMPVMDGLELTRHIKQDLNTSHIPVILLTAKALEKDQLLGLEMGASDYITKPFNINILRLRIDAWMKRRDVAKNRFALQQDLKPAQITITTLDQQLIERAIDIVNRNMHQPDFNVDQLASEMGVHRTGLNRKLQFITGQTPILFIRTLRLKRARQILEADPSQPISQVAYQVGFNNPKIFTRHFHEAYGMNPSDFLRSARRDSGNLEPVA